MNVLDLFSGIGGFSLGLERAGMRTLAFCEIEPYCRAVLAKHWPDVPVFGDVRKLTAAALADAIDAGPSRPGRKPQHGGKVVQPCDRDAEKGRIDVICGGFPCQDISTAGKGAGITGARSGLWSEYARIIGEVRPRYVIVENVAALLGRGLERVLGDLAALGFDAEWHCIPASAIGAPHRRDRVWIVGYSDAERCGRRPDDQGTAPAERDRNPPAGDVGHAQQQGLEGPVGPDDVGLHRAAQPVRPARPAGVRPEADVADAAGKSAWPRLFTGRPGDDGWYRRLGDPDWWLVEPDVGRVAHGVPSRVDRLRALGNAIVPQIAEIIGKELMAHEREVA